MLLSEIRVGYEAKISQAALVGVILRLYYFFLFFNCLYLVVSLFSTLGYSSRKRFERFAVGFQLLSLLLCDLVGFDICCSVPVF